jgi:dephospho-CoA kinase
MFCIGLAGKIASGKSTVAQAFAKYGIDIISADQIARELTGKEQPTTFKIIQHFGPEVVVDGLLNRSALRKIIFSYPVEREWLENLLHPMIRASILEKIVRVTSPYCLIEIPLLTNKHAYPYLNRILLVEASQDTRVARLMVRDNCNLEESMRIIESQQCLETIAMHADDILHTEQSHHDLQQQVEKLHQLYSTLAWE